MAAIELNGVKKRFGGGGLVRQDEPVDALRGIDLTVEEGEIYGFLGPNGAGKSTTINILLDFIRPSAGSARVFGMDSRRDSVAIRERTGVLPEGFQTYNRLTGLQHLEFAIEAKDASDDPVALLERVGIADAADRKAGGYSKGMKQRLVLAMALVGEPDLLILDEPSTGLDPNGAREMREIVRAERDRGATVFFSSHILDQVEAVCDRVGILRDGEMVAEDSIENLRDAMGTDTRLVVDVESLPDQAVSAVRSTDGVSGVDVTDRRLTVSCESDVRRDVMDALEDNGAPVSDFSTEEASLEDLFLHYTKGADGSGRGDGTTRAEAADGSGGTA